MNLQQRTAARQRERARANRRKWRKLALSNLLMTIRPKEQIRGVMPSLDASRLPVYIPIRYTSREG